MRQLLLDEEEEGAAPEPLASRMRPDDLSGFFGQEHLLGEGKPLRRMIDGGAVSSMILWGPPGVGKTTLARMVARSTDARFVDFPAVTSGIAEIRKVMSEAESERRRGKRTVLFVDEIHHFNKTQQDAFLPFVEKGSIILIGATTENPSFELNGALLSRCKVFVLRPLSKEDMIAILKRAVESPSGYGDYKVDIPEKAYRIIADFSKGDSRTALNTLETVLNYGDNGDGTITVTDGIIQDCTSRKSMLYDKNGEEHFQVISALHEAMRNSDVDAALFWLARMLEGGEDPVWIARRIAHAAAEDVGLADPECLHVAMDAMEAARTIGHPECDIHLAMAAMFVCLSPKSNSVLTAYMAARDDARKHDSDPIPMAIRAGYTSLQKELGYGADYQYPHAAEDKITTMQCMPDSLVGKHYYRPTEQGLEKALKRRYEWILQWQKDHAGQTEKVPYPDYRAEKKRKKE
ncbi:MAG: replication-associated recombination protein A [Candidatus Methanomethylophilaceae archaeon]|nr:replication-associated recombination protein A [Candidatus Methanomethylophilaceae archaeon]